MELSRIKTLREELKNETITIDELVEIEEAFNRIDPKVLRDLPENAMASDMLDELEAQVGLTEWTIYNWVKENYGESEANDPSWNMKALATVIDMGGSNV